MSKTLTKHDLKTPDEFITWGTRAAIFVAKNTALVSIAAVLALLIVGGFFAMREQRENREVEAASQLYLGEKLLAAPAGAMQGFRMPGLSDPKPEDLKAAIVAFDDVIAKYPGTKAERRARLLAGDTAMALKDFDVAAKQYEAASGSGSDLERYYALSGKAHALEAADKWDEAAGAYRKIIDDSSILNRDIATLDLARVLVKVNKAEDAKGVLGKFSTDYPNSPLKSDAEAKLILIGGAPAAAPASTPEAN